MLCVAQPWARLCGVWGPCHLHPCPAVGLLSPLLPARVCSWVLRPAGWGGGRPGRLCLGLACVLLQLKYLNQLSGRSQVTVMQQSLLGQSSSLRSQNCYKLSCGRVMRKAELPDLSQVSFGLSHYHCRCWGLAVGQIPTSVMSFSPLSRQGKRLAQGRRGGERSGDQSSCALPESWFGRSHDFCRLVKA